MTRTDLWRIGLGLLLLLLFSFFGQDALAQTAVTSVAPDKPEDVQAVAFGTSTQLGRTFNLNIIIQSYSTPQDQQVLLEAFNKGGNEGLVEALEKMPARGRISAPGLLGYEIKYARVWPTPNGRKIRLITNRTLAIGEVMRNSRSRDYSVSAVELELSPDSAKSTGTLLPACQLKLNKQNEIEVEAYQNPWRLGNFIDWGK
jgi:hypothetical protein